MMKLDKASRAVQFNPLISQLWKLRLEKLHCPAWVTLGMGARVWNRTWTVELQSVVPFDPATVFKDTYLNTDFPLLTASFLATFCSFWLLILDFSLFPAAYQRLSFNCFLNTKSILLERQSWTGYSIPQCSKTTWTLFHGGSMIQNQFL